LVCEIFKSPDEKVQRECVDQGVRRNRRSRLGEGIAEWGLKGDRRVIAKGGGRRKVGGKGGRRIKTGQQIEAGQAG